MPSRSLGISAGAMALSLIALVTTDASSSLLPEPVLRALVVLVAIVLISIALELSRRKACSWKR